MGMTLGIAPHTKPDEAVLHILYGLQYIEGLSVGAEWFLPVSADDVEVIDAEFGQAANELLKLGVARDHPCRQMRDDAMTQFAGRLDVVEGSLQAEFWRTGDGDGRGDWHRADLAVGPTQRDHFNSRSVGEGF